MMYIKYLKTILIVCGSLFTIGCERRSDIATQQSFSGEAQIWAPVGDIGDFLNAATREFNAANLTKITVVTFPTIESLEETLINSMAEGTGPDLAVLNAQWIYNEPGKIYYLKDDQSLSVTKFKEDFSRAAQSALIRDGAIYGIPLGVETIAMFWNEDHIINRLPDANTPPKTWDRIASVAPQLTRLNSITETISSGGIGLGTVDNLSMPVSVLMNLMVQSGVSLFSSDGQAPAFGGQYTATNGPATAAIEYIRRFSNPNYKVYSWNESMQKDVQAFAEGDLSIMFGDSRTYKEIEAAIGTGARFGKVALSDVRTAALPQPATNTDPLILGQVPTLSVPRSVKNPTLAWGFAKYIASEQQQQSLADNTKIPSAHIKIQQAFQNNPIYGTFARQAKIARFYAIPVNESYWEKGWRDLLLSTTRNQKDPQEALKEWATDVKERLETKAIIKRQTQ